ncbi:hypothetical protein Hanom_Chr03g00270461 [Helianthus anomalus]
MIQHTIDIDIPAAEQAVIVGPQPTKTNIFTFFTVAYLFQRMGLVVPLRHLWAHYYPRVAYGEEGVVTPHSTLGFIINALLGLVEIKSQCLHGFPFQTHPHSIMFSVTSLLMYGLASAAELVICGAGVDRSSIYAILAHLGKIGSLCILVASLASLFYF